MCQATFFLHAQRFRQMIRYQKNCYAINFVLFVVVFFNLTASAFYIFKLK